MADAIKSFNKSSKKELPRLPKGAKILNKSERVEVEEIENGFILSKNCEIKYEYASGTDQEVRTDWLYYTRKWFSKTDPLQVKLDNKSLAESFED